MWIPVAFYLAVTLVVPVLDGVPLDRAFLRHAGVVLVICLAVAAAFSALRRLRRG